MIVSIPHSIAIFLFMAFFACLYLFFCVDSVF